MLARLRNYFSKPQGRAAHHPHYLEIIVARTGHPAHTFRVNLDHLKKAGTGLGVAVFVWFAGTFYVAYSHVSNMQAIASADRQAEKIARLKQNNEKLTEEKQHMGQSLFSLQQRVEQLAVRVHGVVNRAEDRYPVENQGTREAGNQGGMAIPLNAANATQIMRSEFSVLNDRLSRLLPQLESTLAREVARPVGEPIPRQTEISSDYGLRGNPFGRGHEFHNGIDFTADPGTPILATGPGVVEEAGHDGPNGNRVSIDHGFGYRSVYAHLSKLKVRAGEQVKRGQVIGLSGNTGRSSGPHLHYTVYYRGRTIDPEDYLKAN
jgi:murein DD-endopeptidase MepM/ murein hydrolase activator NlpD